MARLLRAFTLDTKTIAELTRVGSLPLDSKLLQTLLPEIVQDPAMALAVEELDEHYLTTKDYEFLYTLLPPEQITKYGSRITLPSKRLLTWIAFTDEAFRYGEEVYSTTIKALQERQRYNRRLKNKAQAPKLKQHLVVNASRIAEAFIMLGMEVLKERVASLELERSTGKDVSQSEDELSLGSGRKASTVRAVRGRS